MSELMTRRETIRMGLAGSLVALVPEWAYPALAQGESDVPFTDIPATFNPNNPTGANRFLDIRKIDGHLTSADQFFFIQHYNKPELDAATFKLKLTGMVNKPTELSLAELRAMKSVEVVNGYECSGNSARAMQGLSSNGRFTGVRLSDVLRRAGVGDRAREVVFFGADRGNEDVVFRQQTFKIQQQFARSITLENAMKPEPLLAYALNGEPLDRNHGFPLRLIMPGWYGVANVKWLSEIHLQEDRFLGNYPSPLVSHDADRRRFRGRDRSRHAVGRDGSDAAAAQVGDRPRTENRRDAPGARLRAERWDTTEVGGGQDRRRPLAARHDGPGQYPVFVEALYLPVGRSHARRAHPGIARHRCEWRRAAVCSGPRTKKDLPRGQLPVPAQSHGQLTMTCADRPTRIHGSSPFVPAASLEDLRFGTVCNV